MQFDEGLDRTRARRGGNPRDGDSSAGARPWVSARLSRRDSRRSGAALERVDRERPSADSCRSQQFAWLRGKQLQPDLGNDDVMHCFVSGVGVLAAGIEGWAVSEAILAG